MSVTPDQLKRATQPLLSHPLDHGAWLELAALLGALGSDDAAFWALGEGARIGGQVALAVDRGRHLTQRGSVRGRETANRALFQDASDLIV